MKTFIHTTRFRFTLSLITLLFLSVMVQMVLAAPTIAIVDNYNTLNGQYTSVALNGNLPVFSYYYGDGANLRVATCSNPTCSGPIQIENVDVIGDVGRYTSLALNGNLPVVSYYDFTNRDLKLAVCNNPTCDPALVTIRTIDSVGDVGQYTSLALNGANPVISYYDATNTDLKLAVCGDPTCDPALVTITTVDTTNINGQYTSLVLNGGNPVISYYYISGANLRVAVCSDPTCTAPTITNVDSPGNVGQYTSVALNGSNPVVSYWDDTNDDLKVAVCSNPTCTASTIRTVDNVAVVGEHTSVAVNGGNPVISYFRATGADLRVAACGDPTCDPALVTITDVDTGGTVGQYTSITLNGNLPVVSYYDATNGDLKVAICDTPTCTNQPEIDVQRPAATSIADGGTDALGNQTVGTVTLTYTIDNTAGGAQLDVTAATAANLVNVSGFTVLTALPLNIAQGATDTLQIEFTIDAAGAFSFDLDITNNDPNENPYDIAISGTGTVVIPPTPSSGGTDDGSPAATATESAADAALWEILISANPPFARPGSPVVFTIIIHKLSGGTPVEMQFPITTNFAIQSVGSNRGTASFSGQTVTFNDDIHVGDEAVITVNTVLSPNLAAPYMLPEEACIVSPAWLCATAVVSSASTLPTTGETPLWAQKLRDMK